MRLWHVDLIEVLPRKQLLSQWRECCCIARNIAVNGTPEHLLVNKILDYSIDHFDLYCSLVLKEMRDRGYNVNCNVVKKMYRNISLGFSNFDNKKENFVHNMDGKVFPHWHNDRYFLQCFYNLEEKYDCGGITEEDWTKINKKYVEKFFKTY